MPHHRLQQPVHARNRLPSRRTLLASLISLAAAGPAFARNDDPSALIAEIYRIVGPEGNVSIFFDPEMRRRFLSRRLQAALTAMEKRRPEGDAPDLDFDPVTNGNDPSVHDLRIKTESKNASHAVVIADFLSHQDTEHSVLRYILVRENGWKVDDIVASGKNDWRVSKIIEGR